MESLQPVLDGFTVVLEPTNLLYCLLGVVLAGFAVALFVKLLGLPISIWPR